MFNNMLLGLLEHGRIKTTQRRAQELRGIAERAVTRATRLGDILTKDRDKLDADEKAKLIHAMRLTRRTINDRDAVARLFEDWAPLFIERPGGYTRIYKLGFRRGDNAPMALIEFVEMPADMGDAVEAEGGDGEKKKGFFSRLRGGE
jgi:large subunit ribosomal protein L17